MKIEYPKKVYRDGYYGVPATFTDEERKEPENAWWDYQQELKTIFGVPPVEDNTVGQYVQTKSIKETGHCNGHVNIYGMKVTPINKKLKEVA